MDVRSVRAGMRLLLAAGLLMGGAVASPAAATAAPDANSATTRAVPSGMAACRLVTAGKIRGLSTRPEHVTLALADSYGSTEVRVTECIRTRRRGYVAAWTTDGRVGRTGFAKPGTKREGDGHTPTGVYRMGVAFGASDPGSRMGYLTLRPNSCWGSTVGSRYYNRYFVGRCGPKDETMYNDVRGAYRQGMLINYNTRPIRQGRGSAIFLHVGTGGPTAGCVSIPERLMTSKVRTTRPGDVIAMGVTSQLVR